MLDPRRIPSDTSRSRSSLAVLEQHIIDVRNRQPRTLIIIGIDKSGSMKGRSLRQIGIAVRDMVTTVRQKSLAVARVLLSICTFDSDVNIAPFSSLNELKFPVLEAGGTTALGEMIIGSIDHADVGLEAVDSESIESTKAIIYILTDGYPSSSKAMLEEAKRRIEKAELSGRIAVFLIGTDNADRDMLTWLSYRPALMMKDGDHYDSCYQWIGSSVLATSMSQPGMSVKLPSKDDWSIL